VTHFKHQKLALGKAHPLVKELFKEMNRQKVTLRDTGEESGIAWNTISEWRYRSNPTLVAFVAVANALGLEVVVRPSATARRADPKAENPELSTLYCDSPVDLGLNAQ
jgi:hypothetical protein